MWTYSFWYIAAHHNAASLGSKTHVANGYWRIQTKGFLAAGIQIRQVLQISEIQFLKHIILPNFLDKFSHFLGILAEEVCNPRQSGGGCLCSSEHKVAHGGVELGFVNLPLSSGFDDPRPEIRPGGLERDAFLHSLHAEVEVVFS